MIKNHPVFKKFVPAIFLILIVSFTGISQVSEMKVSILGGAEVIDNSSIVINAGNSLTFQITNPVATNCATTLVQNVTLSNSDYTLSPEVVFGNIKSLGCKGTDFLNFTITKDDSSCSTTETYVTINSNKGSITFTFEISTAPIISVFGGTPSATINNGTITPPANTPSASTGTYFGIKENGGTETRSYNIFNTGSCPLEITAITSSVGDFTITVPSELPHTILAGESYYFDVTFTASGIAGTRLSTISIANTDMTANPFAFNVSAEVFDFNIPGPGGITADFRLWLKTTRGVTSSASKVSEWKDLGSNGKSAKQTVADLQPTYLDTITSNINFNPVIKFENDGTSSLNQYLENLENGFYSQDIFIVMESDVDVTTSLGMTIFSGTVAGNITSANYINDVNDVTGVGLGNFTDRISGERLWFNQGSSESNPHYSLTAPSSKSYSKAGIINARNKTGTPSDGMSILYNSVDIDIEVIESSGFIFTNLGYVDTVPEPDKVYGTPYKIGKNANTIYGNLKGRIAEIFTFAERVPDAGRHKIETYLAIKYGITLGEKEAAKNYIASNDDVVWNIADNADFNYNIAGIGKDNASDLNQKQSKSINDVNEVTIGLGLIDATNSANTNEFKKDGDYLVWGCNNQDFSFISSVNNVELTSGLSSTSFSRINRKWKIVESKKHEDGDVENVYVSIPSTALIGKQAEEEEYVLIVSETGNFADADIIDVIPLKPAGLNLQTWYDFDGTNFFTFGKASKLTEKSAVNIAAIDYLVGESTLELNYNSFTVSAWIRNENLSLTTRDIMAKGDKMQMRLNSASNIEVVLDDNSTASITSKIALNDGKWHQITFVYESGTIFLYVDGILDSSEQNVKPPSPNFNRFSVGALYIDKNEVENQFLGEIDEVYIWNRVLTQNQIRYLMNQEIEKVSGDLVNGCVLPQTITNNEIMTIPWSDLKAFYDFNTFCGSTVEGKTNDRDFLRIKYLKKVKTIVDSQTAPLPYVSAADGFWGNADTWTNSTVQNPPNSVGLDGETIIDWNIVQTTHNITSGTRDITVLGLKHNAGKLTIDGDNALGTGQALRVTHYLELDGSIDLEGESQLVQDQGSILDADSGGDLERDQQGTANSFNYNYWSSSVGPTSGSKVLRGTGTASINANFTIGGVIKDGRNSASPAVINYDPSAFAADAGSPGALTISSYWLYQFYGKGNDYNSWFPRINENASLAPGVGYTMKGSSGKVPITDQQNYVFRGKPYNGDFTVELSKDHISPAGNVDRLIGNPYPSALDATKFILDNLSVLDGGTNTTGNIFNGALYFWDHFGQINTHILREYVGGYATRNLTAGAPAISNDSRINNSGGAETINSVGKTPGQFIPVGQGFFVGTALDVGLTGIAVVTGDEIVFKNSQRAFQRESAVTGTSVFMKAGKNKVANNQKIEENANTRPILRLMYDSPTGYHRQIVMGMVENTSNHFDLGYDAPIADINKEDMYWTFDGAKFVIQGVPNFNDNQEFPLGLIVNKTGLARIKIEELENVDENISVHIKDKLMGETHNISRKPFEIDLAPGTYLDRFALTFKMQKLVAEDVVTEVFIPAAAQSIIEGIHVYMNNAIGELQIKNNSTEEIVSVALINYLGQTLKIWNSNFNVRTISLPISTATGIYLVQINTKTGNTVKKISVE